MRRMARIAGLCLALAVAVLLGGLSRGDAALFPPRDGAAVRVHVVDHGYHAGIVVGAADLRAAAVLLGRVRPDLAHVLRSVTQDYPEADWLEFGWGDAAFYRDTPRIEDLRAGVALRALFVPTPSVVHVVPGRGDPAEAFLRAEMLELRLSPPGVAELAEELALTFAPGATGRPPREGPSLYGEGSFYPALPSYHLLRTCNHWVSALLRAAGVPSSWGWSATSAGLMAELRWRAVDGVD